MWSGPRNISTAMMRSFGARSDTVVSDEPFYGAYLKRSGEQQPMADAIVQDMDCDWISVLSHLRGPPPGGAPIWYQKHMPHHMIGDIDIHDFPDHRHAFLIREPERVIASYGAKRLKVHFDDLRYDRQFEYFEIVRKRFGNIPAVIDSSTFLADPESQLKLLCRQLHIDWDDNMLNWEAGIRPTDGIWASHWYDAVVTSTRFGPPPAEMSLLSGDAAKLAERCRPFYEAMREHALGIGCI
ncbi:MAG: HAD family hydrolase [Pontixanthobacter sp.]